MSTKRTFRATAHRLHTSVAVSALTIGLSAGFAAAQQATADFDFGTLAGPALAHTAPSDSADVGSILAQQSTTAVGATTTGSNVNLLLNTNVSTNTIYSGAYNETSNLFAASATANLTDSSVVYAFSPTTAGDTAVAGSYQSRIDSTDVTASVSGNDHFVDISNADLDGEAVLTGTLLVDNNDMTASATANNSVSAITLSSGVNVLEDASAAQASVVANTTIDAGLDSDNSADILVGTAQITAGATTVVAAVDSSDVQVNIESVDGATVTASNSSLTAAATGNTSAGSISSSDTTATITASTAVSNLQLLDIDAGDGVTARLQGSDVLVDLGKETDGDWTGQVDNSTVTVTANALTSVAEGNDSTQSVNLVANAITGSGTANFSDVDNTAAGVQVDASADIVAANTQVVTGATSITASSFSNDVILQLIDEEDGTIENNTLAVTGNSIASTARAADTMNSITLQAGSTLSATGLVANVQQDGGSVVSASTNGSVVEIDVDTNGADTLQDTTLQLTSNALSATAMGARADNNLTVASGTNNLSLGDNTGTVTLLVDPNPTADAIAPAVDAGFVVVNEQERVGGSVTASMSGTSADMDLGDDDTQSVLRVTSNNDSNSFSATALGTTADNQITLNFNTLTGTLAATGDAVATTANNQTITGGATITARVQDSRIVDTETDGTITNSTITTSSNTVSAVARGNQTTNNDILVNGTNVVITDGVDATPSTNLGASFGDLTAGGAFVSASVQEIEDGTILASQVNTGSSNWIDTDLNGNITGSTIVSELNTLSVLAVGNEAANGVTVGTGTTSAIEASSASANVQLIRTGDIDGEIGVLGSDAVVPFSSLNSGGSSTGAIDDPSGTGFADTYQNNTGSNITLTFGTPLTVEEVAILANAGFTGAVLGGSTATWPDTVAIDLSIFNFTFNAGAGGSNSGDESITINGFALTGTPPTLNNAGVLISRGSDVDGSTLSVTGNTIAGEVRGNVAVNTTSVTATTVTASDSTTASTDVNGNTIAPLGASTVVTNVQSVDVASDIDMAVAGTFAIQDDASNPLNITDSQQNVDGNLQQSYATANRATNGITITATNSTADGVIENDQRSSSTVDASSDLDLMAAVGSTRSTTSIDGNRNESVANGNVETSTLTVSATNVAEEDGTSTDASVDKSSEVASGDAIIGSEQISTGNVTASATTDAFNEEINLSGAAVDNIDSGTVSFSTNMTIAQATANNSTLTGTLGSGATANYDASGAVSAVQEFSAAVQATTNSDVEVTLNDDSQTVLSSTVNLNGNQASASARGNVLDSNLVVGGTNIESGTAGNDADLNGNGAANTAAFVLAADQSGSAGVSANSSAMSVVLDLTSTSTTASDATLQTSTATLTGNRSTATATSNTADNSLALGAVGSTSTLTATGGLLNRQLANQATATGGMLISADIDTTETNVNIVNAVAGSQLSLSSNVSTASATGNTAKNSLAAVSTQITAGSANDANANSGTPLADAGFALLNEQASSATTTSTNTANTVSALLTAEDSAVASSTVSLQNNSVSALTIGNNAENTLSLGVAGTTSNLTSTGALVSDQDASGTKSATAGVTVTADIDSTQADATALVGSTLNVSGNTSVASATNNNVLNTFSAVGTNMSAGGNTDASTSGTDIDAAYGLASRQQSAGTVTATNTANTFTVDVDSADLAVGTSTVGLSSNSVEARATGNIAVNNSMALGGSGTAAISATGAINNSQTNSAVINANADSTVRASLDTSDTAVNAVSGSTVSVLNNSTVAMARGNVAQNVLNVTSAAATGGDGDAGFNVVPGVLTAAYGVLNTQTNSSGVTGTIAATSYEIALNAGAPNAALGAAGSTFTLSGNVADAIAYGNVATNSITLASLNGLNDEATAMVSSRQSNSGAITAGLSGSRAQFSADGAVPGSTVGVSGNAFRSTAVANYATSVVTRN